MHLISADANKTFLRTVILPLSALVVGLLIFAIGGILWMADYQTDAAIAQQARLAQGGLRIHAEKLAVSASDYGYWDEAVTAIVDAPDLAWITDNIGAAAEKSLHAAMSFVLDPDGYPVYSRVLARDGVENPRVYFSHGFELAHAAWKKLEPGKSYSGIVPYRGSAAIIAIAPVRAWSDSKRPATGYSLMFVQLVDGVLLKDLARDYELEKLRVVRVPSDIDDIRATISISDGHGIIVSRLAWDALRPGDGVLRIALPFMALFLLTLTLLGIQIVRQAITSAQTITDREKQAFHDPLTNLANRSLFFTELETAVSQINPGVSEVSVMYIDLDGFKAVNDTLGHTAGDQLLQQVAERLKACVRETDRVARLGGDEFAIILANNSARTRVKLIASEILAAIARPFDLPAGYINIGCSIGIATSQQTTEVAAALLDRADRALYEAKASGKNAIRFSGQFHPKTPILVRQAV